MGDRVSIQFRKGESKSAVLFSLPYQPRIKTSFLKFCEKSVAFCKTQKSSIFVGCAINALKINNRQKN